MIKVWEDEVIKDLKQCGVKVGSDSLFYECLYCEDTGDHKQSYSIKKRPDGFTDLVHRVTMVDDNGERYCVEPEWTYVELPTSENQRGKRSRRVTELYGS